MPDNRLLSSKMDRRVEFSKPSASADAYNENTDFEVVYSNFPAHRKDSSSSQDESEDINLIRGEARVEWVIRFLPNLNIATNWKLKDLHDGQTYEVTAPPTEIGRRQEIRIVTKLIQ
ncbi:head-tail adaptor protein [Dyadobacter sp. CY345]|uniref:phage head completion protein n=1 Tax=Dyadobacter sp. CY345 TaxID=2909335 RepID=UPI001F16E861|nr:head-tail adaptor protein [Dyadobacter sp. CY345]MCF2443650.1 head-tail adaptor protein [Dyadobacter sp. CY345]